jgi:hypothetical protein
VRQPQDWRMGDSRPRVTAGGIVGPSESSQHAFSCSSRPRVAGAPLLRAHSNDPPSTRSAADGSTATPLQQRPCGAATDSPSRGQRTRAREKGGVIAKLFIIGALIAALAIPAAASAHRAPARHARIKALCPQSVVFLPGRDYAVCGGRFWIRDPETGQTVQVSFWRLQHRFDPSSDRP